MRARSGYVPRLADRQLDAWLGELPAVLLVGPRASGKTTTARRRAATVISLDVPAEAVAFRADPDAALRGLAEPVLLDEWQVVPEVLGAVRRAVDRERRPGRYLIAGSVRAAAEQPVWAGTGRVSRATMYPLAVREQVGRADGPGILDRLVAGTPLVADEPSPDLRGYVELALAGGFPEPALRISGDARRTWLRSYLDDLLSRDIAALEVSATRRRDPRRLRRYFEAYALNSAGVPDHATIFSAAGITAQTAEAYESLLTKLFAIEQVPAWASNRLKRVLRGPKRYLVEAGLFGAALRVDAPGVMRDGDLLGRLLDTFVAAQLRPEIEASSPNARRFHLRTQQGRREIDVLIELGGRRLIALEVKATASPDERDAAHLAWLRDRYDDRFLAGVVMHTGPRAYPLGDRLVAAPISALWAA